MADALYVMHVTTYTETLAAVSLQKSDVHFSKPIYVGFAVLEISKELMYDYHYNVMRRHYNDSIRLMYMDICEIINYYLHSYMKHT